MRTLLKSILKPVPPLSLARRSSPPRARWLAAASALAFAPALIATAALAAPLAGESAAVVEHAADGAEPTVAGVTVTGHRDGYRVRTTPTATRTATRTATPLRETPQAVTVVTEALIEDQSMRSMGDVLRYVPGASMAQGEGHRDAPVLRGNASTSDFFVDGVRDDVQYFRDLYNVDRVEVLKGPNAMIFGRGGGGGVINRVTKRAGALQEGEVRLEAGSYAHGRATVDLNQPFGPGVFGRLNAMYENSESFRDHVELERWGINPTVTFEPTERLVLRLSYEHFEDDRTVDRGVPSLGGRPVTPSRSTFFGDPGQSYSTADVDLFRAMVEYEVSPVLTVRNHTLLGDYDKFYQNVYPGAVNAAGTLVSIAAYNNATVRENLFNQTDVVLEATTGALRHTLLFGAELGRQEPANYRSTGFFNNSTASSILVPFAAPTLFGTPITFRQSASDGDNSTVANVAALYVQDQLEISPRLQLIGGLRFDRFDLDFHDNRTNRDLSRTDEFVSPRVGVVFKPVEPLSLYAGYSVSYLPASGDQFASLSPSTALLEPEEFENLEVGAKWEIRPDLLLTGAVYRLDRTNTTARDPLDPARIVQTGGQRTTGVELEVAGQLTADWQIVGGYAFQDAEITSATTAAPAGRKVALSPRHTFSLWNKYRFTPDWAAGLGVVWRDESFTSFSNDVVLPSFTRVDAAVFYRINDRLRAQLNVENLFDEDYFVTAHSDTNITPGSPRAVRAALTASF